MSFFPKYNHIIIACLAGVVTTPAVIFLLVFFNVSVPEYEHTLEPEKLSSSTITFDYKSPVSPFLQAEEIILIEPSSKFEEGILLQIEKLLFEYVEVVDGCGTHYEGECLNVRSGPGVDFPVITQLRNGIILKIEGKVENDDIAWYKIAFDEWVRYPNRLGSEWYVASPYVKVLLNEGDKTSWEDEVSTTTKKRIVVNRTAQTLTAYNGDELFMEISISTGLELSPTPRGEFTIFKKTPSRYMQGPIPGIAEQYYDMPGVPWNLYFTHGGAVIHGAYWHNSFGTAYSHGCVNLPPIKADKLYSWADLGTKVIVTD